MTSLLTTVEPSTFALVMGFWPDPRI